MEYEYIGQVQVGEICSLEADRIAWQLCPLIERLIANRGFPADPDKLKALITDANDATPSDHKLLTLLSAFIEFELVPMAGAVMQQFSETEDLVKKLESVGQVLASRKASEARSTKSAKARIVDWAKAETQKDTSILERSNPIQWLAAEFTRLHGGSMQTNRKYLQGLFPLEK